MILWNTTNSNVRVTMALSYTSRVGGEIPNRRVWSVWYTA